MVKKKKKGYLHMQTFKSALYKFVSDRYETKVNPMTRLKM